MCTLTDSSVSGFILAAGEGRRLRPATLVRPKCLVPFCGVPLLELAAGELNRLGLNGIAVNACYQGDRVGEAVRRLAGANGLDLRVSMESRLLDTGGGLRRGLRLLPDAGHVLVHNVDVVVDFDLRRLVRHHLTSEADVTLLLVRGRGPRTVSVCPDGSIDQLRNMPGTAPCTFTGIHVVRRKVIEVLPEDEPVSVTPVYQQVSRSGGRVLGLILDDGDYWADLGNARDYIRSHGDVADLPLRHHPALRRAMATQARRRAALEQRGVTCTGALGIGDGVLVPSGSHLHNVVLWDYTCLPRPHLYADGIFVGNDVRPPPPVTEHRSPDPRICAALDVDPAETTLEPLQKQGSGRRYCRLRAGARSWIWSAYDPERRENAGFTAISDFLRGLGIRVPEIRLHLADAFEIVTHDLGQHDLQRTQPIRQAALLRDVAEQVARLHVLGDQAVRLEELPLRRGFTKGVYDWERDYFREHLLDRCLGRPELWSRVAHEYCGVRDALLREPLVPIHRDLQSANIMIVDNDVYLIDFQGMRLGAAAYDLGSLLYDPYQCYPAELRNGVWDEYAACVRNLGGTPPSAEVLRLAAVQRLLQALGAYGKLWLRDGLEWYRPFIVPGLRMLTTAAAETDALPAFRDFAADCLELAQQRLAATPGDAEQRDP